MKKFIALALALVLVLTASVALAAGSPSPKPVPAPPTFSVNRVIGGEGNAASLDGKVIFRLGSNPKALEIASVADFSDDAKAALKTALNVDDEGLAALKIVDSYTVKIARMKGQSTPNTVKVQLTENYRGINVIGFIVIDQDTGAAQYAKVKGLFTTTIGAVNEVYVIAK